MTASVTRRPVLLSPTAHHPADAALATFSWQAAPTDDLLFQLAADRRFEEVLWEVPVKGITHLTLQSALPKVNTPYYWRVGRGNVWSAPAAFRAATDADVASWEWARHEATIRAAREEQRVHGSPVGAIPSAVADEPHRTGQTSRGEALLWVYFVVAGFAITIILLVRAVLG